MEKTHGAVTGGGSPLKKYQNVMVGSGSLLSLLYFEWCVLLGPIPGIVGMALRKIFWPRLFASCGRGCLFSSGIVLRHPRRIRLGDSVVIAERCVLDGRGSLEQTINIGDNTMLSNDVVLSCKNGRIDIGANVGINSQAIVQSTNGCEVVIGNDCILGQRCLIIGGGSYNVDSLDVPIRQQGIRSDGGVILECNVWIGANVSVLGGVKMGSGSIAATGAVVTKSVPLNSVCMGVPAKVVRSRE
jgi:galactoside O-acetyltransferase